MKVSIRPAPHSKTCAIGDRKSYCGKFDNQSHRCEAECPAGYCCEMKHCWQVGEKLRDILIARGHEVKMADKKYRKGSPESKANDNTKKAMAELMAWEPDVHVAIHTNSSDNPRSHGIRIGYPPKRYDSVQERLDASYRLAECVVAENKKIYWKPDWVASTNGYNFYELNAPQCPAIYIEGCFANSNVKDANWWHDNMDAIAKSYADALEAWWVGEGHTLSNKPAVKPAPAPAPEVEKQPKEVVLYAKVKPSYPWRLSLWSDNKKSKSLAVINNKYGIMEILSEKADSKGYYYCRYEGKLGYVNGKYIVFIDKPETITEKVYGYVQIRKNYTGTLNVWSEAKKGKSLVVIEKNTKITLLSDKKTNGYYYCEYKGHKGYVNAKYVQKI